MSPGLRQLLLAGAVLAWTGLATLGCYEIFVNSTTPGDVADVPARWPAGSRLPRGPDFTIAIFVHPECPCSRASLHELAALVLPSSAVLDIVVAGPAAEGELWDRAGEITGAVRIADAGREAARFGARTSGYTVVYDRAGVRRFAGGITGSRGHVGDNVGRDMVQRILAGSDPQVRAHAVFGCALVGPE